MTLDEIRITDGRIRPYIRETPTVQFDLVRGRPWLGLPGEVFFKLELFQHTGSFKLRGALANMLEMGREQMARGVTTASGGNHAMAVSYAARQLGTNAKVVMPRWVNPVRLTACRNYGAEVELAQDVPSAYARVEQIARDEGRAFVHPFEGELTARGTGTVGLELLRQVPDLDAVIVPAGGGGLAGGIAAAVKQARPQCRIFGAEPEGAANLWHSLQAGEPTAVPDPQTIADSLKAPHCLPVSFGLCRQYLDGVVRVTDDEIRRALAILFHDAKLAVEPAGAVGTAALAGPLHDLMQKGRRVAVIVCGANIDADTFTRHLLAGDALLQRSDQPQAG